MGHDGGNGGGNGAEWLNPVIAILLAGVSALVLFAIKQPREWVTDPENVHPLATAVAALALAALFFLIFLKLAIRARPTRPQRWEPAPRHFVILGVGAVAVLILGMVFPTPPKHNFACRTVRPAEKPSPANLISNPSFEEGDSGWGKFGATVVPVACTGAADNKQAAKVTRVGGGQYTIDSLPVPVESTKAGCTYRATAYAAAASPSARDKVVRLYIRQSIPGGQPPVMDWKSSSITLKEEFQQLSVSGTTSVAGNGLDIYLQQDGAEDGDAFYADDFTLMLTTAC